MILWLDAQLPPRLASWQDEQFVITALVLRELGLRDAIDAKIIQAASAQHAIIMTKDRDIRDRPDHGRRTHPLDSLHAATDDARDIIACILHATVRRNNGDESLRR